MTNFSSSLDLIKERIPNLVAIYLYGSHANGRARSDSDVDFGVLADSPIVPATLQDVHLALSPLHDAVDLVDLREVPLTLAIQVIDEGKVLFCHSDAKRAKWETTTMSRYAHLNEERREILEDIRKRGKIYG
jgi:uncharacterized protein